MSKNMDYYCAQYGAKIGEGVFEKVDNNKSKAENHLTKSLGILQEDGLYAFALYQLWKKCEGGDNIREGVLKLLGEEEICLKKDEEFLKCTQELTSDLNELLLARRLIERTLTYALYRVKGLKT